MEVLVTGGAGFIGSHLAARLAREGHGVVVLDNLDPYYDPARKRANLRLLPAGVRVVRGDAGEPRVLRRVLGDHRPRMIFHIAARPGVRASLRDPLGAHGANATATLRLLETARDKGVGKVVFASSSSVYGDGVKLPLREEGPLNPVSPYGVAKLAAEHYCRVFHESCGLRTTCLRLFTVYGPRMRPDLAISVFTRRALAGRPIEIFGRGTATRDFTYVEDAVEAHLRAMTRGDGGTFNIGGGTRISVLALARRILALTGSPSKLVFSDPRPGEMAHTWADVTRARRTLGWRPRVDLDEGLRRTVEWFRAEG